MRTAHKQTLMAIGKKYTNTADKQKLYINDNQCSCVKRAVVVISNVVRSKLQIVIHKRQEYENVEQAYIN